MLTYEKVIEIFSEYLADDKEVEVVKTSRGYVRLEWAGDFSYCDDSHLCRTPGELFDQLLSDCQTYEELKLTRGRRELTQADRETVQALLQPYLKKREVEETK